jgi:hypothetical protein
MTPAPIPCANLSPERWPDGRRTTSIRAHVLSSATARWAVLKDAVFGGELLDGRERLSFESATSRIAVRISA